MTAEASVSHGYSAYAHGCRCDICREAKREYVRRYRLQHREQGVPWGVQHGLRSTYQEYGCRCPHCRKAQARETRRQYLAGRSRLPDAGTDATG